MVALEAPPPQSAEHVREDDRWNFRRDCSCGAAAGVIALMAAATTASAEEIKVWTLTFANDSANKAWQKIIADFEAANPGTTIRIENRGVDEHKSALRVAAGSDQGPDIYFMWAGLGLGGEFVKAGLSLPLDKYYKEYGWSDRFLPSAGRLRRHLSRRQARRALHLQGRGDLLQQEALRAGRDHRRSRRPMRSSWPRPRS